jgi:thiol-disulfide isomerase/thioredoxin
MAIVSALFIRNQFAPKLGNILKKPMFQAQCLLLIIMQMKNTTSINKMATRWILGLFSIIIISIGCSDNKSGKSVQVKGTFAGGNGQVVRLSEMKTDRILDVDSAVVQNETFRLSADVPEAAFFLLQFSEGLPITLVMSPGDVVELTLEESDRKMNYHVKGNRDSELLMDYYNQAGSVRKQLDSLRQVLFERQSLPDFVEVKASIDATLDSLLAGHKRFTQQLIQNNPSSLAAILLLNKSLAGNRIFTIDNDIELFRLIDEQLMAKLPANSHVALHHRRVEAALQKVEKVLEAERRTSPGQAAPDVKLTDPEGKLMALRDLEGTTTLLFFWASWSPESRADLQLLKEIYQKPDFHDFEVFAVSLDHKVHFWKAALDVENTTWVNVNEPSGLGGSLARLFNLPQNLPYYFVIDSQGIIQLKTDHFTEVKNHLRKPN